MNLRAMREPDLDFVVGVEAESDVAPWITPEPRAQHRASLANPDHRNLVFCMGTDRVGYAKLTGATDPHASVELRRIVVVPPGAGLGRRALDHVLAFAFDDLGAHRLFLDVLVDNDRARRLYEQAGFQVEGVMRDAFRTPAGHVPLVLMSLLAHERLAADDRKL